MRDITGLLNKYEKFYKSTCTVAKEVCNKKCDCHKGAEIRAYINTVIPELYRNCTLSDFTGDLKDGTKVLSVSTVARVKKDIIKYCWKNIDLEEDYDTIKWLDRSIMNIRHNSGNNLVICGKTKKQAGRSLIASLVIKEAIFQRLKSFNVSDTYDWVPYNILCNRLMAKANSDKQYDEVIIDYLDADWLVVDGFIAESKGKQFRASVLDQFFGERLQKNLPNILVFQQSVDNIDDIESEFGLSVAYIVKSQKTLKIDVS